MLPNFIPWFKNKVVEHWAVAEFSFATSVSEFGASLDISSFKFRGATDDSGFEGTCRKSTK